MNTGAPCIGYCGSRPRRQPQAGGSWRAGCVETRTPGSEGGSGKRTTGNGDTAPRPDPYKKALASVVGKVRSLTRRARHRTLADLLRWLNPTLRGWCNYFRHGVSSRTFNYVDHFAFWRIVGWLRKRHPGLSMRTVARRYLPGWRISDEGIEMFRPYKVNIERYRYRGARIPTPWSSAPTTGAPAPAA